jgi:NADH-quinone oxidoreductase subunit G
VPAYKLDRLNLLGGNDVATEPGLGLGFVPVSAIGAAGVIGAIAPAHDGLFTSGTLGRYSPALKELQEHQNTVPALAVGD